MTTRSSWVFRTPDQRTAEDWKYSVTIGPPTQIGPKKLTLRKLTWIGPGPMEDPRSKEKSPEW
eukprot:1182057-Prorocentrum_minimum.AAC.3